MKRFSSRSIPTFLYFPVVKQVYNWENRQNDSSCPGGKNVHPKKYLPQQFNGHFLVEEDRPYLILES